MADCLYTVLAASPDKQGVQPEHWMGEFLAPVVSHEARQIAHFRDGVWERVPAPHVLQHAQRMGEPCRAVVLSADRELADCLYNESATPALHGCQHVRWMGEHSAAVASYRARQLADCLYTAAAKDPAQHGYQHVHSRVEQLSPRRLADYLCSARRDCPRVRFADELALFGR